MLFHKPLIRFLLLSIAISSFAYGESLTPLRHFAEYSTWSDIKVSPSGQYLAGIVNNESGLAGSKLVVIDTVSRKYLHEVNMTGRAFVARYIWANNERLIAWEGKYFHACTGPAFLVTTAKLSTAIQRGSTLSLAMSC